MFWLLVTGTGRCGTGFAAQVLVSAGVKCSHEGLFNLKSEDEILGLIAARHAHPEWGWQAESSWLAAPFLGRPELDGLTVVHLVRHPKHTIDSMVRTGVTAPEHRNSYWRWQRDQVPGMHLYHAPAEQAALVYLRWNERIEPYAHLRHRVEDDPLDLLAALNIDVEPAAVYRDTTYNTRAAWTASDVDLEDLPAPLRDELQAMCERYGYRWPAPKPDLPAFLRQLPGLDKPERWLKTVHHNTFCGLPMQQSWADIALWERVIPLVNPAGIVELGTYLGGLSTYLALQARQRGIDFWTFDNQARPALHNRMVKQAGVMRAFNRVDVFSDVGLASIRAIVDDARNHPLLFLCDDGNKPQELAGFAPLLWPGDVVGVHDWGAEITNRDLRGVPRLEPLLHNEAGAVGSLLRFWRVTA